MNLCKALLDYNYIYLHIILEDADACEKEENVNKTFTKKLANKNDIDRSIEKLSAEDEDKEDDNA